MKRSVIALTIVLCMVLYLQCGDKPLDVGELGETITRITFGKGWDQINNVLTDTTRVFNDPSGTNVVYYEIRFEKPFDAGGMIKKRWERNNSNFLDVTSFMPIATYRICGEMRFYEEQPLEIGDYRLTVWWYSTLASNYEIYEYSGSVEETFTIE